jgi:hypothetical protein
MIRRTIGLALLALSTLPLHRLLASPETGLAGQGTVSIVDIYYEFMWTGLMLVVPVALISAILLRGERMDAVVGALAGATSRIRALGTPGYALLLAAVAALLTLAFTHLVLDGRPNFVDSLAQMAQARFWAEGLLAGPAGTDGAFWLIQNTLLTERGWVSQYPPGHVALLALAIAVGAPAALGALLVGLTVYVATLLAVRLFPDDRVLARVAPALLALSPFFVLLGGSFMNHATAALFITLGAYGLCRAWQDRPAWAFAAGGAFAFAFATRPLATLAMGAGIALSMPLLAAGPVTVRRFLLVHARALAGALPLLLAFFAYNMHFFGGPMRMGYEVALGPAMSLGFHRDPWGNMYGPLQALAYTSADLVSLNVALFESPLPAVAVIGLFLLFARSIGPGTVVLMAWAFSQVAANAIYWHHGQFMGPRMLHDAAPAWVFLFAVSAFGLVRALPRAVGSRPDWRAAVGGAMTAAVLFGLLFLMPQRAASYGREWLEITRTPVPRIDEPSLVFVHDAWTGRIAMTLAAHGYRFDEIETLLRQNTTCTVHELARATVTGDTAAAAAALDRLDRVPRADRLPPTVQISPGNLMRVRPGDRLTADCMREVHSDRFGILDIAPLFWKGDVPGGTPRGPLFVRDLGPDRNAAMIAREPGRSAWIYAVAADGGLTLMPYQQGVDLLWNTAP